MDYFLIGVLAIVFFLAGVFVSPLIFKRAKKDETTNNYGTVCITKDDLDDAVRALRSTFYTSQARSTSAIYSRYGGER